MKGGRAFPNPKWNDQDGMFLRDYFAAKAMQGMVINQWEDIGTETIARNAYDMADAMLKARDK